jgi:hypothetical protein
VRAKRLKIESYARPINASKKHAVAS